MYCSTKSSFEIKLKIEIDKGSSTMFEVEIEIDKGRAAVNRKVN